MQTYLIEEETPAVKEFCALQYANMGQAYLDAARILNSNTNEIRIYKLAPVYFCVSHSIELFLKAFLIKKTGY